MIVNFADNAWAMIQEHADRMLAQNTIIDQELPRKADTQVAANILDCFSFNKSEKQRITLNERNENLLNDLHKASPLLI